ncbi:flagellar L-ring protein precursor FlgH [Tistlia consotensis]|uniref:Flagellar L-ring protein n=1 Tax=Tistlia consotensis USBA 355 TaxID=560819 RepID=A0A1Y6CK41_9PROT|nr:flagellar basal body L-ring protein FlgH [Tistlia consotensis]SMF67939.1 flagellar L-ring protein precursor FlgH [Tistlia consotensis USBA 355]SNR99320.1 flagellar L-ring protein precursor FlgH [Tistlia consotensis]
MFARSLLTVAGAVALGLTLSGCNALTRLSEVGSAPSLSQIENPAVITGAQPVAMPMPAPEPLHQEANSLWRPGSRAFFKDQRASDVGDILTVVIQIDDSATLSNKSDRTRTNSENAGLPAVLGFESKFSKVLPSAVDPSNLIEATSDSSSEGTGSINRSEAIDLRVAAMVTQVLPNGNLVIAGRQETRVNFELRQLQIAGIIRPEDLTSTNTINWDQIAEARISYGGRGTMSDVQQPRYGQQLYDILWPF